MIRRRAAALLVVLASAACSHGTGSTDADVDQGLERLDELLTAAVAATDAADPTWRDPIGPGECTSQPHDAGGRADYSRAVDLEVAPEEGDAVVAAVGRHWADAGYDVEEVPGAGEGDELTARADGFSLYAVHAPRSGTVRVGGQTPCLPPAEAGDG